VQSALEVDLAEHEDAGLRGEEAEPCEGSCGVAAHAQQLQLHQRVLVLLLEPLLPDEEQADDREADGEKPPGGR
jgi:hypothetical protein